MSFLLSSGALCILKKFKNIFTSFKKLPNKILKVANDVSYKRAKSQFQMFSILSYTKITKFEFLARFEITIQRSTILHCFLRSLILHFV